MPGVGQIWMEPIPPKSAKDTVDNNVLENAKKKHDSRIVTKMGISRGNLLLTH